MPIKVFASAVIKVVLNRGRPITIEYATRTPSWRRLYLSPILQAKFARIIKRADVPPRATIAVMVEPEHTSPGDMNPHYTVLYLDDDRNEVAVEHESDDEGAGN